MKFLQKRWVAVLLCAVMVLTAVGIRINRNQQRTQDIANRPQSTEHASEYLQYIYDNGSLSDDTVREVSGYLSSMDEAFHSICALALVEQDAEDAAWEIADRMKLRATDCLLVLDTVGETWYFLYEDELYPYVNSELQSLVQGEMNTVFYDLDTGIPEYYASLYVWYRDNVGSGSITYESSVQSGSLFVIVLVLVLVLVVFFRARCPRYYRASPVFFFGAPRHRTTFRGSSFHRPEPGHHRSSGSFGGSHRGGFGGSSGGHRGGFGGSSGGRRGGFGK